MATNPLERHLQASVVKRLKKLQASDNTFVFRNRHGSVYGAAGDPDLYGLWRGLHFEIELKQPGQNPTPLQAQRLMAWESAGAHTFVVRSLFDLDRALHQLRLALP